MKQKTILARHEFLIRRLHSLSGLIPFGAYMVVHLLTNSTVLDSDATFQRNVYQIHSLPFLPVIEWTFIFLPILFHAVVGVVIVRGGLPNSSTYTYSGNIRYVLQRATGMIAFAFIVWHMLHMHGVIHADWWLKVVQNLGGAQFKPYNATSTAGAAIQQSVLVLILYAIGVLACVFHLANGIWTMGITWGAWTTPPAQRRASLVCTVFGIGLSIVGLSALWGMNSVDVESAREVEDRMYQAKTASGLVAPNEHKRSQPHDEATSDDDGTGATEASVERPHRPSG